MEQLPKCYKPPRSAYLLLTIALSIPIVVGLVIIFTGSWFGDSHPLFVFSIFMWVVLILFTHYQIAIAHIEISANSISGPTSSIRRITIPLNTIRRVTPKYWLGCLDYWKIQSVDGKIIIISSLALGEMPTKEILAQLRVAGVHSLTNENK